MSSAGLRLHPGPSSAPSVVTRQADARWQPRAAAHLSMAGWGPLSNSCTSTRTWSAGYRSVVAVVAPYGENLTLGSKCDAVLFEQILTSVRFFEPEHLRSR